MFERRKNGSEHNISSTHYNNIPHTILLKTLVSKKLLRVVLLQYMVDYTCYKKLYIIFAKKTPVASAENAIFITRPPHLFNGHTKLIIKKNHPITKTILFTAILFKYCILHLRRM